MEIYETDNPTEDFLRAKADALNIPLGGGIELLPLCNMSCNMCYVRHDVSELECPLLRKEDWIKIGEELKEAGTLFLLITGGEPLLHPDFKEIYLALSDMGFIITINTNGTLIDEEWANFFKEHPCRRLNITLYGTSNDTYTTLCHNPKGFSEVTKAIELLLERDIMMRLNFTLTKENRHEIADMVEIAHRYNMPFIPASYLFPPGLRSSENERFYQSRMSAWEAAETRLQAMLLRNPQTTLIEQARLLLNRLAEPHGNIILNEGFTCSAARSGYWINWKGELTACGMLENPGVSLKDVSFNEGWKEIVQEVKKLSQCDECNRCKKKFFCQSCPAACLGETGDIHQKPTYLCEVTDAMIDILLDALPKEERNEYQQKLY